MSKMKTNRGAAKRCRRTGKGGFKRAQSHLNHILTKKRSKRKRQLGTTEQVADSDQKSVRGMLPYSYEELFEMARVKRGVTAKARHKKVLDTAKGYYGARSKVYRVAKQA